MRVLRFLMLVKHILIDIRAGSKVFDACVLCSLFFVRVPRFLMLVKHTLIDIRAGSKVFDACVLCVHCVSCGFHGFCFW